MTQQERSDRAAADSTRTAAPSGLPERPVSVVLIDDHQLFRQGLRVLLERAAPGIEIAGDAATSEAAIALVTARHPDVALMDLNLRDEPDGAAAIRRIRGASPGTRVVVLSIFDTEAHVVAALRAGATGYLTKSATIDDVVRAIELAVAGGSFIDPALAPMVLAEYRKMTLAPGRHVTSKPLTQRDLALLELLVTGLNNRQIAAEMKLAESTVKNNLSTLFKKLGVRDRTQAVLLAIESGLATPRSR